MDRHFTFISEPQKCGRTDDFPKVVLIVDVRDENPYVKTFTLELSVGARPGQFVMLWIPRVDEKPFSVAFDDGHRLQLTIACVGPFTEKLFALGVGDKVGIRGPYGVPFSYVPGETVGVVGGGYGAAPLYFLAHEVVRDGGKVEFFVGARSADRLLFLDRVEALDGANLHVATDDGTKGERGFNVDVVRRFLEGGGRADRWLTVGPERMMRAVSDIALEHKVPCQVSVERYMKCGFGVCGQCVIDDSGIATCMEGPVMDHLKARAQSEFGAYHRDAMGKKKEW